MPGRVIQSDSRLLALVQETLWAILPQRLEAVAEVIARRAAGVRLSPREVRAAIEAARTGENDGTGPLDAVAHQPALDAVAGQTETREGPLVAVIPVWGVISHRAHMVDDVSGPGGTSTEKLGRSIRAALNDERISAIVLDVDSPGGSIPGVAELAREIYEARGTKPIVAVANALAASAAYWIATAADELVITPSGDVGSVGVFAVHVEGSKFFEDAGIKHTLIKAGPHKAEFNDFEPLADEARDYMQTRVDEAYNDFISAVARHRNVAAAKVRADFGGGRVIGAKEAVRLGMADRVATLDETIARFASGRGRTKKRQAAGKNPEISGAAAAQQPAETTEENDAAADESIRLRAKILSA